MVLFNTMRCIRRTALTTVFPKCSSRKSDLRYLSAAVRLPPGFRVVRAGPADRERMARLARRGFFPDEPLNVAAGRDTANIPTENMNFLAALDDGCSFVVEDASTGNTVGVGVNSIVTPESMEQKGQDEPEEEALRVMLRVLRSTWLAADLWSRTTARRALEVHVLAVAPEARGHGLAAAMLHEALRHAKHDLRLPLAVTCVTSAYSEKLMQRAGMRLVYTRLFADTELPRSPPPPHERLAIYMIDLHG